MAPSPQKASWRRVDTTPSDDDDDDVGVGGVSSVSRQQSSMLAGQGVSSSLDDFPLPSTTFQAISSPTIAISPSSSVTATTSPAAISTPPLSHASVETSSQPLSDALSPTNTQSIFSSFRTSTFTVPTSGPSFVVSSKPIFTPEPSLFIASSSRSLPAVTTEPFAATGALDVIASLPLDVQSTPQPPSVSLGGDAPVITTAEFTDVPGPTFSTPTGKHPQAITAASIGGPVVSGTGIPIPSGSVGNAPTVPERQGPPPSPLPLLPSLLPQAPLPFLHRLSLASAGPTSSNPITRFFTITVMTINSKHRRSRLPLRLFFSLAH
ncbi:hypothetical protein BJV77DRAFT_757475 [Russula vinacea]|nr:hypothetical protein BJV77DRAFT_757475 [Russula vinacea]